MTRSKTIILLALLSPLVMAVVIPPVPTSFAVPAPYGARLDWSVQTEVVTVAAASSTAATATLSIAAGDVVEGIAWRVIQAPGGGATAWNLYFTQDANDQDCLGDNVAVALGTTGELFAAGDGTYTGPFRAHGGEAYTLSVLTTDGSDTITNITGAGLQVRLTVWTSRRTPATN